ncbi:hypothetical protein DSECCO2_476190 [anaerobic digester metagenome]
MTAGACTSPSFKIPLTRTSRGSGREHATRPMVRGTSRMAPCGQTRVHPPQEWQRCGKVRTQSFTTASAPNRQNLPHSPQRVQRAGSISGTGVVTGTSTAGAGKKRWRFGSSTSQSTSTTSRERAMV